MQLSLKGLVQLFLTDIVAYRTALHDLPLFFFFFFFTAFLVNITYSSGGVCFKIRLFCTRSSFTARLFFIFIFINLLKPQCGVCVNICSC